MRQLSTLNGLPQGCHETDSASSQRAENVFPLAFAQESLWFIDQIAPGTSAYNMAQAWRLRGVIDVQALQLSLDSLVARHESLRTVFRAKAGKPQQVVLPPRAFALQIADLTNRPEPNALLAGELEHEAGRPFDLAKGPLARAVLFRLGAQEHVLVLNFHHIISDEWSVGVFLRECAELYNGFVAGAPTVLPELPIQYPDYAVWQRQSNEDPGSADLKYWFQHLRQPLAPVCLQPDRLAPVGQPLFQGITDFSTISQELTSRLKQFSREHGVTLFMTLLTAFKTLLLRYTRQTDITVGSPMANRSPVETEGLIGLFVHTHALRTDLSGDPSFVDLLNRVREVVLAGNGHQAVPPDKIIELLHPARQAGSHPLFQVVFGLQNAATERWPLSGLETTCMELDNGGSKFDWTLLLTEGSEGLRIRSEYNSRIFSAAAAAQRLSQFKTLLQSIAHDPRKRLSELSLLSADERAKLVTPRATRAPSGQESSSLAQHFETRAFAVPANTAVSMGDASCSYAELNAASNRLGNYLKKAGVKRGMPVALCIERSPEMIVGILGVLKAGGCYVPLDPASPRDRLAFMLQDCSPRVIVTQSHLADRVNGGSRLLLCLDSDREKIAREPATSPGAPVGPEDPAYIIYTSGSTGQPKGVLVSQGNVLRLFRETDRWFGFNEKDVWTLFHSYTFDFSVWEIWGALLYGGRLVVVPYLTSRSPAEFYELLASEKVTVLNQTPSAFRQLIWAETTARQARELSLRYVICGGEALELQSLGPWFKHHGDLQPEVVNMYGITETTVHVTYRVIRQADVAAGLGSVIGVPIADLDLYLLDERLEPVPAGVPGEICVSGAGVASGYLNRPELTAARFVPDPFANEPGRRMYRSGDLARRSPAGELEYLGRMDDQVKIRGFRIELGEIESALNRHTGLRESAVVPVGGPGETRLIAYVVPKGADPAPEELRGHLAQLLPDYMIPSAFVRLAALPLTSNGKIDRKSLPDPVSALAPSGAGVAPRNDMEALVARIWSELLGRSGLGIHDNFFQAGGHSLLATQAISRLAAALDLELSVRLLFDAPTVAELAAALSKLQGEQGGRRALAKPAAAPNARELLSRLDDLTESEVDELLAQLETKSL